MKKILFVDIPVVSTPRTGPIGKIIGMKYKTQDIMYAMKGFNYAYQRSNRQFTRGLLTISSYIKQNGFDSEYHYYKDEGLEEKISSLEEGDIVGLPTVTAFMDETKKITEKIKNANKNVKILLGGYHATALPEKTFEQFPEVDYIISKEAENPVLNLMKGNLDAKGISRRDGNNIIINKESDFLAVEDIPNPDYSILPGDLNSYNYNVQTARGCDQYCHFCVNSFFWKKVRNTPIKQVEKELVYLKENLEPGRFIHFSDNILTVDKQRVKEISEIVKKNDIDFQFSCDVQASYIDDELIQYLSDAGFKRICIGFEDTNQSVLDMSNKNLDLQVNLDAVKTIRKNDPNIIIEAYWITGLPGSTNDSLMKNINIVEGLLKEKYIDVIATSTVFTPLPGTPMFKNPKKYGMELCTDQWQDYLRANFFPTYKLTDLDRNELLSHFVLFESHLLKTYLEETNLTEEDVKRLHPIITSTRTQDINWDEVMKK